jgi:phosphoribosyl 1,2-cyclic phosphodiesterase
VAALRIRFWGVRGSYPTPGRSTLKIGGNSSCVEVGAGDKTLVFDAGTGIIRLGADLVQRPGSSKVAHIFLSHMHHDHIEGLRFFDPFYRKEWDCRLFGQAVGKQALEKRLRRMMGPPYFPVAFEEIPARPSILQLSDRESVRLAGRPTVRVDVSHSRSHPRHGVSLYRVTCAGRSVVYATDVEGPKGGHADVVEFARGADVLIHDAQYTDEEYSGGWMSKVGWGHSTVRMAAEAAQAAGVGKLLLFHHDPTHDDAQVRRMEREAKRVFPASQVAYEGLELEL